MKFTKQVAIAALISVIVAGNANAMFSRVWMRLGDKFSKINTEVIFNVWSNGKQTIGQKTKEFKETFNVGLNATNQDIQSKKTAWQKTFQNFSVPNFGIAQKVKLWSQESLNKQYATFGLVKKEAPAKESLLNNNLEACDFKSYKQQPMNPKKNKKNKRT